MDPAARAYRDTLERLVCPDCGFVSYDNPKIVVGAVDAHEGRLLLCRRAIMPRKGFWTLPAGYLELNETVVDGARREAWEEARARIEIDALLAVYNIPRLSQVQLIFRARSADDSLAIGPETLEGGYFAWEEIPWAELAFPSVVWALNHHRESVGRPLGAPFGNPPGQRGDYAPGKPVS